MNSDFVLAPFDYYYTQVLLLLRHSFSNETKSQDYVLYSRANSSNLYKAAYLKAIAATFYYAKYFFNATMNNFAVYFMTNFPKIVQNFESFGKKFPE